MDESAAHAGHDPVRVAEAVDRGAPRASVLERCRSCAALFADLLVLRAALPLAALPARTRDYTLRSDVAARLRPRGWRAWWAAVGSARDVVTRPLAVSFTTLGVAGLLLTSAPAFLPMAASAPTAESDPPARVMIATTPNRQGDTGEVPVGPPADGHLPSQVPWLGLLILGGGLFAVRRVAAHRGTVR